MVWIAVTLMLFGPCVDTILWITPCPHSLITHPATTSHGRLSEAQRQAAGIGQGMVRLAVGLEHVDDITDDLQRGLGQP